MAAAVIDFTLVFLGVRIPACTGYLWPQGAGIRVQKNTPSTVICHVGNCNVNVLCRLAGYSSWPRCKSTCRRNTGRLTGYRQLAVG
jgi:hypothetical protein